GGLARHIAHEGVREAAFPSFFWAQELICKSPLTVQCRVYRLENRILMKGYPIRWRDAERCLSRPVTESELALGLITSRGSHTHHVHRELLLRSEELLSLARVAEKCQPVLDQVRRNCLEQGPQESQTRMMGDCLNKRDAEADS